MTLSRTQLEKFKETLSKASGDIGSNELVFFKEWVYTLPSQSLQIKEKQLHVDYDIPTGFNGYGESDLEELIKQGFLKKTYESIEDPITLEQTIKYEIKK